MARKQAQQEEPETVEEEQEQDEEQEQEYEGEENGTSINSEETITIAVPRDGNEGETLTRVAKLVDGLGE